MGEPTLSLINLQGIISSLNNRAVDNIGLGQFKGRVHNGGGIRDYEVLARGHFPIEVCGEGLFGLGSSEKIGYAAVRISTDGNLSEEYPTLIENVRIRLNEPIQLKGGTFTPVSEIRLGRCAYGATICNPNRTDRVRAGFLYWPKANLSGYISNEVAFEHQ